MLKLILLKQSAVCPEGYNALQSVFWQPVHLEKTEGSQLTSWPADLWVFPPNVSVARTLAKKRSKGEHLLTSFEFFASVLATGSGFRNTCKKLKPGKWTWRVLSCICSFQYSQRSQECMSPRYRDTPILIIQPRWLHRISMTLQVFRQGA